MNRKAFGFPLNVLKINFENQFGTLLYFSVKMVNDSNKFNEQIRNSGILKNIYFVFSDFFKEELCFSVKNSKITNLFTKVT